MILQRCWKTWDMTWNLEELAWHNSHPVSNPETYPWGKIGTTTEEWLPLPIVNGYLERSHNQFYQKPLTVPGELRRSHPSCLSPGTCQPPGWPWLFQFHNQAWNQTRMDLNNLVVYLYVSLIHSPFYPVRSPSSLHCSLFCFILSITLWGRLCWECVTGSVGFYSRVGCKTWSSRPHLDTLITTSCWFSVA